MLRTKFIAPLLGLSLLALGTLFWPTASIEEQAGGMDTPEGRFEYELMRLADPMTGEIPENIRMRELAYVSTLPKHSGQDKSGGSQIFHHIGPYNVGGRTRALAIDITNNKIYFAGGVSGGLWRSVDDGLSWTRVTPTTQHAAVSCIAQDTRAGKTKTWYYGSGESIGNSASKSFSAMYRGSGMYKSTDGGLTWTALQSTATPVNKDSDWATIFNIAIDPSRNDSDIVYASTVKGIMRSNDGGSNWSLVIEASQDASFTEVKVSSTGIAYAALSSDADNEEGFWRSDDGIEWHRITPSGLPNIHQRTVMDIAPSDEDVVFFFTGTPNAGTHGMMLHKYEYVSGKGTGNGGTWTDLSPQLPDSNMNLFNGYCQVLKVKPNDIDVIFLGGTNLYRSLTGWRDTVNNHQVGGYKIHGDTNYHTRTGYQHPDQQNLFFLPNNPEVLVASTDGGVHRSLSCTDTNITWSSLNNGYVTTQFYGIGIDHGTMGSNIVLGGLQDQGTYWTNTDDENADWVSVRGSDGAHVAVEDGGGAYYISTQYANIRRMILDSAGKSIHSKKVMPPSLPKGSGSGFLFVHPFTLDRVADSIMYLPHEGDVWRNTDLAAADSGDLSSWTMIESHSGLITAIASSENTQGLIYFGMSNGKIYRMNEADQKANVAVDVSRTLYGGGYTSCIAIDPNDGDKVMVVFSNYNVVSLWYTADGGDNWESIEGNLQGTRDPGLPDHVYYIGDGPSIRWAEIIPTPTGNRYFVGTSVGLFSTNLLAGDSTEWIQEGASTIGNVVVDMLDYRHSDRFLAVGTHGNGIYTTTVVQNFNSVPDQSLLEQQVGLFNFPNPAMDETTVQFELPAQMQVKLALFDQRGRQLEVLRSGTYPQGVHRVQVPLRHLPSGTYYYRLSGDRLNVTKALIKS